MTLGKTLYKTAVFAALALAVFTFSIPKAKVLAWYTMNSTYSPNLSSAGPTGNGTTTSNPTNTNYNCMNCGSNGQNNGQNNNVVVIDSKPVISTEPALDVKKTSAVIQGAAHVDSGTATVWFEYGTRVDKLDNTTRTIVIDPSRTGASEQLTNLAPGTKYFYRIVARNNAGLCFGVVRSFTTTGGSTAVIKTAKASTTETYTSASSSSSTSVSSGNVKGSLSASAANANSSSGFVPTSIIGWILIIFLVLAIVMTFRKIQLNAEEKKKREEEAKKAKIA